MTDISARPEQQPHACCAPGPTIDAGDATDYGVQAARRPIAVPAGMVRLDGGVFLMGTSDPGGHPADGEGPVHRVHVDPFWIDPHSVSNGEVLARAVGVAALVLAVAAPWLPALAPGLHGTSQMTSMGGP